MPAVGKTDSDAEMAEDEEDDCSGSDDSSSSHGSDATDTSDLDLDQCLQRKSECLHQLCELERQFAVLKQQLFGEKLALLDARLAGVRDGTASEYLQPLGQLEETYEARQQTAVALKQLRLVNGQHQHDAELLAADQNLASDRSVLALQMRQELEERLRRLEDDRRQVDISSDLWCSEETADASRAGGKAGQRAGSPGAEDGRRRRKVVVSGPYIVYMLSDPDIMEDWATVKKALSVVKRKGDFKVLRDVNAMWGF